MKKRIATMFLVMMSVLFLGATKTYAETIDEEQSAYGASDIDRIYITSDTALGKLEKTYVPAKVEVVKADGTVEISDGSANVKLRGNSTAKAEKKPFKIKFAKKQSVLGMDQGKKWNVLANAFDKTLIRNKLGLDLADKLGLSYISQNAFVDVYYNDVLLGNYLITEPVEAGSNKVDIEETATSTDFMLELERERYEEDVTYINTKNGLRFAINVPEEPTNEQVDGINAYVKNVETALKTYKLSEYAKYIDVDSFVNYYILSEIFKAVDFNYSSTRFYVKDNKMYAGPVWDLDLSSGNASKVFYSAYYQNGVSYKGLFCTEMKWYNYLMKSDEFVQKVNERLTKMYPTVENLYKTNSIGTSQIDMLTEKYAASFARNYKSKEEGGAGWSLTKRYSTCDNAKGLEYDPQPDTYEESVNMLCDWLSNRVSYLKEAWAGISNNYVDLLQAEKKTYNSVQLNWYNAGASDGNEIEIKSPKGTYRQIAVIEDGMQQEYIAKNIKPGVEYTFRVRSFVMASGQKVYTDYVEVSKKLPFKSPKVKVKKVSSKKRKLTWKKVKGAEGYAVYFGTSTGNLKKIKTIKGNKKLTYTKSKLKANKKYYFKVKAFVKEDGVTYYSK